VLLGTLLLWPALAHATDLSKVDRTIRKEPAYQGRPRYCLLALGPEAKTRIWLVLDGKALYVDRNDNGDLTEAGELVRAEQAGPADVLQFRAGEVTEAGGKARHTGLTVYQYLAPQFGHLVNTVGRRGRGGLGQTTNGESGFAFADTPGDAPVIHMNGPLALRAHGAVVEHRGVSSLREAPFQLHAGERVTQLHVQVGTPGLGQGTFAALAVEQGFPADLHPNAEVIAPSKADPGRTKTVKFELKGRC
jgi:hypothetical protein